MPAVPSRAQQQQITVRGRITDGYDNPLSQYPVAALYNGDTLATAYPSGNGYYKMDISLYGNIKKLNISLLDGHKHKEEILVTSNLIQANLKQPLMYSSYGIGTNRFIDPEFHSNNRSRYTVPFTEKTLRMPTGNIAYYKTGYWRPVLHPSTISYHFSVIGKNGKPIPNAKVSLKTNGKTVHWGKTGEDGKLSLHIDFDESIFRGQIYISANGFKNKNLMPETLNSWNARTVKLK